MYIPSSEYPDAQNTASYQDRFYINDGRGRFTEDLSASGKLCVYEKYGKLQISALPESVKKLGTVADVSPINVTFLHAS